jgi:hypothetical protein
MSTRPFRTAADAASPALEALSQRARVALQARAWIRLDARELLGALDTPSDAERRSFRQHWQALEPDPYYPSRERRYAELDWKAGARAFTRKPDAPHVQDYAHNPVFGGIPRRFAALTNEFLDEPLFHSVFAFQAAVCARLRPAIERFHVELHPLRVRAARGGTSPTPEGAHQDGRECVFILFVERTNVSGGRTLISALDGSALTEFELAQPFELVALDDRRVRHATSTIHALDPARDAWRDVLVTTFRNAVEP